MSMKLTLRNTAVLKTRSESMAQETFARQPTPFLCQALLIGQAEPPPLQAEEGFEET